MALDEHTKVKLDSIFGRLDPFEERFWQSSDPGEMPAFTSTGSKKQHFLDQSAQIMESWDENISSRPESEQRRLSEGTKNKLDRIFSRINNGPSNGSEIVSNDQIPYRDAVDYSSTVPGSNFIYSEERPKIESEKLDRSVSERTDRAIPQMDTGKILNRPEIQSGVLLDNGSDAVPQPGDMTLPSGSILRKSDADADRYFREQVLPAIERVQETADARAESAFEEASKQRNQRWISGFNIDPVGDFVADAVEQIATDRRERGPARIVKDVMDQLDPQQVNAYVADRVSEDPEFAAAAERLRQLLPDTDTSVNDEEIEQLLASMTPAQRQQFDRDVVEEQKRISEESAAFQKAADAAWARQSNRFQQDMTDRLIAEMARRNMPENEWQAFLRTAYNASIPGLLTELSVGNRVGEDQALHSRIMQLAMERYDPSLLSGCGNITTDPENYLRRILTQFKARGVRRLAYVDEGQDSFFENELFAAYRKLLPEFGMTFSPDRCYFGKGRATGMFDLMLPVFAASEIPFDGVFCPDMRIAREIHTLCCMRRGFEKRHPMLPLGTIQKPETPILPEDTIFGDIHYGDFAAQALDDMIAIIAAHNQKTGETSGKQKSKKGGPR